MEMRTILVVEDNKYNMKLVRSLLQIGGFKVIEAWTAEEGLVLIKKHVPDLILMDIQLPGMDGLAATRQIQADLEIKDTPVIALTAYAMKGDEQKVLDAGCVGYISKPLDTKGFLKALEPYLPNGVGEEPQAFPRLKTDMEMKHAPKDRFYSNKILIVDDDPLNVKLLKAKLAMDAFVTIEAYNGHECLNKVKEEHPDLILLDLMMPGISGFEVTKILKNDNTTKNIPIIHVTALDSSDDKARALEAGADEFLNKPINTKELLTRIRSLLKLKKYQEQLSTRKKSESHFLLPGSSVPGVEEISLKVNILVADNNEKDVAFIKKNIAAYSKKLLVTGSGKEAVQIAESEPIDLVILDIPLSDMDGYEVCEKLKKMDRTRNIQVLTITSLEDLESKIKSIELGTDDYLVKPVNELEFKARIKSSIRKKAYLDLLVSKYETAFNFSIKDQLTSLYNHAFFKHYLGLELSRSLEQKHFLTLTLIDIDDFKRINDLYGHQEGDRVLRNVADIIRANVREIDVCARYGGEEFVVVLPYADLKKGGKIAERIRKSISNNKEISSWPNEMGPITVSIGVAVCPQDALDVHALIYKADMAMYEAKKEGKNRVSYSSNIQL